MPIIENEYFKVEINLEGGCFKSIYDKLSDRELLYQVDERSWKSQDVVIFPVVGAIRDRIYEYEGTKYAIKNHGVIRYMTGRVASSSKTAVTIAFTNDSETIKRYPFVFEFKVSYELSQNQIIVNYHVLNRDNNTMYFELGGHPAIKVLGHEDDKGFVFEETTLKFDKSGKVLRYVLNEEGNLITGTEKVNLDDVMNLSKDVISQYKTIILDASKMKEVTLQTGEMKFRFDISQAPILAIWTKPGYGDFICIEPWWGIPDSEKSKDELKKKAMMVALKPGKSYDASYTITYERH